MSSELPPPKPGDRASRLERSMPNYAVRRALVAGAAVIVTALAVAAVFVTVRGGQDDDAEATTAWNAIALVSRDNGAVRVVADDGEEIATIRGTGRVEALHSSGDDLALIGASQIALVGLDGGEPVLIPIDVGSTVSRVASTHSFTLAVAPPTGGNLTIIDAATGNQLDVGALAEQTSPMLLADSIRADRDGTAFAIGDGRNFQTVVVRFGRSDATFFPDVPMAVADDLVVTAQTVGTSTELGLFDADGVRLASIASEQRPIGGVIDGERFVFVSGAGVIFEASADSETPVRLGVIALPDDDVVQTVWPALDGTRLIAAGNEFQAVIDLDGTTLHQTAFTAPTQTLVPTPTWRCLPVGGSGVFTTLVDLESGDEVADLLGTDVDAVSADGCGVQVASAGGRSLVTPAGSRVLPAAVASAWLAPDASAAVLVDTTSTATLAVLEDDRVDGDGGDGDEPAVLGDVDGLVAFLDR